MESMTGFARVSKEQKNLNLSVQVKSLNARFLEFKFNMPSSFAYLEEDFRKELKKHFSRGTLEVNFYFRKEGLDLPIKSLKKWVLEYKRMAKALGVIDDLSMSKVLQKSTNEQSYTMTAVEKNLVMQFFRKTVQDLKTRRLAEGKNLKVVLNKEISDILRELGQIKSLLKKLKKDIHKDWSDKVKKLKFDAKDVRLESEVALLLEKSDITEEVDRIKIHLKEFSKIISAKMDLKGKKLDFFCQELAREANTIASKSKSSDLTRLSVNLKSNVEKLRQQVQNIQ